MYELLWSWEILASMSSWCIFHNLIWLISSIALLGWYLKKVSPINQDLGQCFVRRCYRPCLSSCSWLRPTDCACCLTKHSLTRLKCISTLFAIKSEALLLVCAKNLGTILLYSKIQRIYDASLLSSFGPRCQQIKEDTVHVLPSSCHHHCRGYQFEDHNYHHHQVWLVFEYNRTILHANSGQGAQRPESRKLLGRSP